MALQRTFMGLDFSTQQLKVIIINETLDVIYEDSVKFDEALGEFQTSGGVHIHEDSVTVTAPTLMWVKALDILLDNMKSSGKVQLSSVAAISGAGQQHGSVFWSCGFNEKLKRLDSTASLYQQFVDSKAFSIKESPVWMDSSTTKECNKLEKLVGGKDVLLQTTGSRAYERFTGPQISKIYEQQPAAYENTERVSLVSSFGASLFIGDYAPIDWADASGMNLFDIKKKDWSETALEACAPKLRPRLGNAVPSHSVVGDIASYFCDRFGFSPECKVVAFTGDNPSSLAGLQLAPHEVIVSLGTSDTLFLWLLQPAAYMDGHVFINPVDCNAYMGLLCYKNGSLMRETVRNENAAEDWAMFEKMLLATKPGNDGNLAAYFDQPEITPSNVTGRYLFDKNNKVTTTMPKESKVRGVIEGQFIAKRLHAENMGFDGSKCPRILATGGASASRPILQVLADVFGIPVYTLDVANSAALGGAFRAKHGLQYFATGAPFSESVTQSLQFNCAAVPNTAVRETYDAMVIRYKDIEKTFLIKS